MRCYHSFFVEIVVESVNLIQMSKQKIISPWWRLGFYRKSNIKNCTQENVKCRIQHEDNWLRWIVIEQVIKSNTTFRWKKLCSHTFKASSEEVIVMHSEKLKAKYTKEDVWKRNLQAGISQLHYRLTSSQMVFMRFKYFLRI